MKALLLLLIYYSMFIYSEFLTEIPFEITNICVFVLLFILSIVFNRKIINKDIKSLKSDLKKNFKNIIILSLITLVVYSIASIISGFFLDNVITEESVADSNVIRVVINLLIWAPITEELIFRSSLKECLNKKILFIIISSLLFTGVHVLGNGLNIITLVSSLPYIVLGIYFALLYEKTNNIIINMIMHLLINVIGVIMILSML